MQGKARIWVRISGEALNSTQLTLSVLTAIEDCVRGLALILPLRKPSHIGQLQFHCGNPPPAAEPNTLICIIFFRQFRTADKQKGGF